MSNPNGSTKGETKTMLSMSETLSLAEIVKKDYTDSGMDNVAYAASVNANPTLRVKFRKDVTESNVRSVLDALGIKNNRARFAEPATNDDCTFIAGRVAALEDQVNRLTNFLKTQGLK